MLVPSIVWVIPVQAYYAIQKSRHLICAFSRSQYEYTPGSVSPVLVLITLQKSVIGASWNLRLQ